MNAPTIDAKTFTVAGPGGTAVAGTVTYSATGWVAKFTPAASLKNNTVYTATITTGVKNSSGTALAASYKWTFTTIMAAPKVTVTAPATGKTGVPINQVVSVVFSEQMETATIDARTFTLTGPGSTAVTGTVAYLASANEAKFTPSANLKYSTTYTAAITTAVKNAEGVALPATYKWTFTTEPVPIAPKVTSTLPAGGASSVELSQAVTATFSLAMNPATIDAATFTVTRPGGGAVAGAVTYSAAGSVATFKPTSGLAYDTVYTATITAGAKSATGVALATKYTWTFTTLQPPPNTAYVDFGSAAQTIRGFGGSTAWITDLTAAQAVTIFGTGDSDLGLSILRVRIDPSYTTGGPYNWGVELNNAQLATAQGATVIATPWTPPAAWKLNTDAANALWGGTLNPANYEDYANYLESFVTYFANNGVKLYGISMQNEPDATVQYESCSWTGQTMDTWVANNSSVLTTKLIMPESEGFNTSFSDPGLDDPDAVGHIGIVAGHIYGQAPTYYTNAESKGKEVWMTEHYVSYPGIYGALGLAKELNDSMTVAEYNAYLWWWIFDYCPNGTSNCSYSNGLVDVNGNPTINGYAMAQYSRFVRPGYVRSNATYSPSQNVYVSAYKGDGHYVIVAINLGFGSQSQTFLIQNQTVTGLTPYETSASQNVAKQSAVSVSNDSFTYTLPAQSITTFVQ
jgi:glucuronoarabinoxylan endo-1,4-beta-xylanase